MTRIKKTKNSHISKCGGGIVNSIIDKLPIELHLPGYQYCGPGTKLQKRLERGDPGINQLDAACKKHDIAYANNKDLKYRQIADKILQERAWSRVVSRDAGLSERANALLVTNAMKLKKKIGSGVKKIVCKKGNFKSAVKLKNVFRNAISNAKNVLKLKKPKSIGKSIKIALRAAKSAVIGEKIVQTPRIIPVPKTGGVLPFLIPLFAGLSAAGALSGGIAGIVKAVNDTRAAKKQLNESIRHNKSMESISIGKGLFLGPHKKGLGLYLNPASKNF